MCDHSILTRLCIGAAAAVLAMSFSRANTVYIPRTHVAAIYDLKYLAPTHLYVAGDTLQICNRDPVNHSPFSLSAGNKFNLGPIPPGQCRELLLQNPKHVPILLQINDAIHSHEPFQVIVSPLQRERRVASCVPALTDASGRPRACNCSVPALPKPQRIPYSVCGPVFPTQASIDAEIARIAAQRNAAIARAASERASRNRQICSDYARSAGVMSRQHQSLQCTEGARDLWNVSEQTHLERCNARIAESGGVPKPSSGRFRSCVRSRSTDAEAAQPMRPQPLHQVFAFVAVLVVLSAQANAQKVHDGITADELITFARGEGWRAERGPADGVAIAFGGGRADITMLDCDSGGRCGSGLIRRMSFESIDGDGQQLWHWNLAVMGATGFGPDYVTLQRYLHFRGVKVIGKVWPKAAQSFWSEVEKHSRFRRGRAR